MRTRRAESARAAAVRAGSMLVLVALLGATTSPALAQPPSPPPNPSDEQLERSRESVTQRADQVGRLTAELAELDSRTDDLQAALAAERETAEAALVDLETAREAAAAAARRAEAARVETGAATVAIDEARERLDEFVAMTYQEGLDAGPLGLLTAATSPEDLVARAEFNDAVARSQLAAQEQLEKARVGKANADSAARATLVEEREREAEAAAARTAADAALAAADAAARENAVELASVQARRTEVEQQLADAESRDAGLREQRDRYRDWQRRMAEEQAARERAEQQAAAARLAAAREAADREAAARAAPGPRTAPAPAAGGSGGGAREPGLRGPAAVRRVIDRAMSQIGVQYVWGGGNGRGPSTGIPDIFGSPLDRVGFDCSGLMLYAFNGVGVSLPRVSRNQFHAGRKVPISDLRPGDMVFYRLGSAPIHHVAMYIGDGRMIEAPYTGANVRVVPLRRQNLVPQATRML